MYVISEVDINLQFCYYLLVPGRYRFTKNKGFISNDAGFRICGRLSKTFTYLLIWKVYCTKCWLIFHSFASILPYAVLIYWHLNH